MNRKESKAVRMIEVDERYSNDGKSPKRRRDYAPQTCTRYVVVFALWRPRSCTRHDGQRGLIGDEHTERSETRIK